MEQLILILIPKILFHIRETIHIERMHKIVSEFSALDPWLVMGFGFNGSICAQKKPGEVKITVCVLVQSLSSSYFI